MAEQADREITAATPTAKPLPETPPTNDSGTIIIVTRMGTTFWQTTPAKHAQTNAMATRGKRQKKTPWAVARKANTFSPVHPVKNDLR
mmetsp:Transcript_30796/g.70457  ORF Transcript_30796/g.70457 Transcript_30796/m.70457 type:complete len:88 (+) Transcript_30796:490-753(+)